MNSVYHPGELKVQALAGVAEAANGVGRKIYPLIAHVFVDFIQGQRKRGQKKKGSNLQY
jgi:hypothetical protein